MIEILFDLPGSINQKAIDAYMKSLLGTIGAIARAEAIRLAKSQLKSTLRDYERSITPPRIEGDTVVIEVLGDLANMVEGGWSGGDLRQTLLKNHPKARINAQGKRYAYVPFRHSSPGSSGRSGGAMTKSVAKAAKGLSPTLSIPMSKGVQWGKRLPPKLEPKMSPHHKTDIYAGMYRQEKTYSKATQSSYVTFRTISESSPMGWTHPGIEQFNFLEQAAQHVEDQFDPVIQSDPPLSFEG